jgi:hypothetical protein
MEMPMRFPFLPIMMLALAVPLVASGPQTKTKIQTKPEAKAANKVKDAPAKKETTKMPDDPFGKKANVPSAKAPKKTNRPPDPLEKGMVKK